MSPKPPLHLPRVSLSGALALAALSAVVLLVASQGDDGADSYSVPPPDEQAKMYVKQLSDELAESDLPPAQAGCVQDAIFARWTPEDLVADRESGGFYVSYFTTADQLIFSELARRSGGDGKALYDTFVGCGVDLRQRAIRSIDLGNEVTTAERRCVVSSATPEAMREHWKNHFTGSSVHSAYQLRVESRCTRSYDELLHYTPPPRATPSSPAPPESSDSGDSFCGEQLDLIWKMYREGQLSDADFEIQMQEIEDSCIGF